MSCHPHLGVLIYRNYASETLSFCAVYFEGENKGHRIYRALVDYILRELIYESVMQFRMD